MPINGGSDTREISRFELRDAKEVKDRKKHIIKRKKRQVKKSLTTYKNQYIQYIYMQSKILLTNMFAFCFHTTHTNEMIQTKAVSGKLFLITIWVL